MSTVNETVSVATHFLFSIKAIFNIYGEAERRIMLKMAGKSVILSRCKGGLREKKKKPRKAPSHFFPKKMSEDSEPYASKISVTFSSRRTASKWCFEENCKVATSKKLSHTAAISLLLITKCFRYDSLRILNVGGWR